VAQPVRGPKDIQRGNIEGDPPTGLGLPKQEDSDGVGIDCHLALLPICEASDALAGAEVQQRIANLTRRGHKTADQGGDFIGSGVQSEMAAADNVDLRLRHIAAVGPRFRRVER
jgi:hypothetical protein